MAGTSTEVMGYRERLRRTSESESFQELLLGTTHSAASQKHHVLFLEPGDPFTWPQTLPGG